MASNLIPVDNVYINIPVVRGRGVGVGVGMGNKRDGYFWYAVEHLFIAAS